MANDFFIIWCQWKDSLFLVDEYNLPINVSPPPPPPQKRVDEPTFFSPVLGRTTRDSIKFLLRSRLSVSQIRQRRRNWTGGGE